MNLLSGIRVIVLDFDGVIVDSEGAKRSAWYRLLEASDPNGFSWKNFDHDALIKEAHRAWVDGTAKGSRYEIIEHMMDAVKYPKTKESVEWYAEEYGRMTQEAILAIGVPLETQSALENLAERFPLYLNSATPEDALGEIVKNMNIAPFFRAILGKTPEKRDKSKVENIKIAAEREKATAAETLFVGDAASDYKAALEAGCPFIRFTGFDLTRKDWAEGNPPEIKSLAELI